MMTKFRRIEAANEGVDMLSVDARMARLAGQAHTLRGRTDETDVKRWRCETLLAELEVC